MATHNEKEIKRHWPITEGLTARTQKQEGRTMNLVPRKSFLRRYEKEGLN